MRSVVVLEDLFAEPLSWNTVAAELASGLRQRGVPLLHAFFRGIPDRFHTESGLEMHLEDLEDDRRGYLVLVFSDGKGLASPRAAFVLETLARWPQVAWMQLQEPRAWDQSAALPAYHALPVFPASRTGLLQVVDRFTTECAPDQQAAATPESWRGLPLRSLAGRRLADYVETLLGDSLLWAQACAMVLPPFSLGLADRLRQCFHPDLPPERRQRLFALPGTVQTAGGLSFSPAVTAVLREGFARRRSPEAQEEVLAFVLERIREAEPPDPESQAHQAWEWRLERLRLELDPDHAMERLAVLAQGPLRGAIQGDLSNLRPGPDGWGSGPVRVPLRVLPRSRRGKRLLTDALAGRDLAPPSPPAFWPKAAIVAAGAVLFGLTAWLIVGRDSAEGLKITVRPGKPDVQVLLVLEKKVGERWQPVSPVIQFPGSKGLSIASDGGEYRVSLLADSLNRSFSLPPTRDDLEVSVMIVPADLNRGATRVAPSKVPKSPIEIKRHNNPSKLASTTKAEPTVPIGGASGQPEVSPGPDAPTGAISPAPNDSTPASGEETAVPSPSKTQGAETPSVPKDTPPEMKKLAWKVGEPVHEDLQERNVEASSLPPGVNLLGKEGRLEGVPTEAGTWDSEIYRLVDDKYAVLRIPVRHLAIEVRDPHCQAGQTFCGTRCIEMQKLSPFHAGACFAIAPSLQKSAAGSVDKPPDWKDESLQPRHYYRLYYEWNQDRTAVLVRSLKTSSGWDRGIDPAPVALVLPVVDFDQGKHQFLATDLEVHCSGGVRVASFSGGRRSVFEKLSTSERWIESLEVSWSRSPATSTDQSLTRTLGPILKPWEELCARKR